MPTLLFAPTLDGDGRPTDDPPRRYTHTAPLARVFSYEIIAGGGLTLIPAFSGITQVTALVFTVTGAVGLYLNGQTAGGVDLSAGAVVALLGLTDTIGLPLWQLTNGGLDTVRVRGVAMGSA